MKDLLRLMMLADEDGTGTGASIEPVQKETQENGDSADKQAKNTFTQQDVNNVIARERKLAQEGLLKELGVEDFENAKDGLAQFKAWQEAQKTEQEKANERYEKQAKELEAKESENSSLRAELSALKAGVSSESVQDVVLLAKALVSEEVDFDTAVANVIEKYPHFKATQEPSKQVVVGGNPTAKQSNTNTDAFKQAFGKY